MRDSKDFKERFARWKNGEQVYDKGRPLPAYQGGKDVDQEYEEFVDGLIKREGFISQPKNIGDGKITIGSGLTDKKWLDLYKQKGVWSQEDNRMAVKEELANRVGQLRTIFPEYDYYPTQMQYMLQDIHYNVGDSTLRNKSPKFVEAMNSRNWEEAKRQMDWSSKNDSLKAGLLARNNERRAMLDLALRNYNEGEEQWARRAREFQFQPPVVKAEAKSKINTDYSPQTAANTRIPSSLNAMNGADAPTYGGTSLRVPNLVNDLERQDHDPERWGRLGFKYGKSSLPKYEIGKGEEEFYQRMQERQAQLNTPKLQYVRQNGNPISFDEQGNLIDQVTGQTGTIYQEGPIVTPKRYDAYGSTYDPKAITDFTGFIPGVGDIEQGFMAKDAFDRGNYLQAGLLGGSLLLPNVLEKPLKYFGKKAFPYIMPAMMRVANDRLPKVMDRFRNAEIHNFLATVNGDNYYRIVNKHNPKKLNPSENYFLSHTTPWQEFSKGGEYNAGQKLLYEFPTETFGKLKSTDYKGNITDYDVTELGRLHSLYGDWSSSSRRPVRIIDDESAKLLDMDAFTLGIPDRPLNKTSGLYDTNPVYENIYMGNQTTVDGATLQKAIQESPHARYYFTPNGVQKVLYTGK